LLPTLVISKHAAYVVIGYLIAHYETPANFVQQVYLSLLRTNQDEGRVLVTQALELIATVFPNMCNADDRNPIWAVTLHQILTKERQYVQQITTVLYFLAKHAVFFYKYRDKFIILIVKSLRAIAQPPNPSNQSKQLVLQLMTLVWQWEQRRVEGEKFLSTEKRKFEDSSEQLIILLFC
jgi:transformation/transcription domain-associated protein